MADKNDNNIEADTDIGIGKSERECPSKEAIDAPDYSVDFPIVAVGASAGGLAAFEAFFSGVPDDGIIDMAFVVVQHLSPDHKSALTEIIKTYTKMKIFEVEDAMKVEVNCTYIIPPNHRMALVKGALMLYPLKVPSMPIDYFFESMAREQHGRSICVILSGMGMDGTLGLRAIKAEGGLVIAQIPNTTAYSGMPTSAIQTNLVDYQLNAQEMVSRIKAYVDLNYSLPQPYDSGCALYGESAMNRIFLLLRQGTGHDFSKYKSKTINRRIERRMIINKENTIDGYIKYLQNTPDEVHVLFNELLIGVTNFFRDKEAFFEVEKRIIPMLFKDKPPGYVIRVWCAGCSTGEEAYSIAILLQEYLEMVNSSYQIQIFATDIDAESIAFARAANYPKSISEDITDDRLSRFFSKEADGSVYRINKAIRDMVIFSEQSLIKDPPFSKLDLITCRNLMIYLTNNLQKNVIPLFHYALKSKGILFLGSSETVGSFTNLFHPLDRKLKLYQRIDDVQGMERLKLPQITSRIMDSSLKHSGMVTKVAPIKKQPYRELMEQAVIKESPYVGGLVNEHGDILYLHGRCGKFIEPCPGEVGVNNILKMARVGLKRELTTALNSVVANNKAVRLKDIQVKTNGHFSKVNIIVKQVGWGIQSLSDTKLYAILFSESLEKTVTSTVPMDELMLDSDIEGAIEELRLELRIKDEHLQSITEELETANEELKSTNEEMQSVNEELQSTNEELETSKEELQSINEELSTVNSELLIKVRDLSQLNDDMNSLLSGTNIATIFLDYDQNIMRYTLPASQIINLIPTDVGRPFEHIVSNILEYKSLNEDIQVVLDTLYTKKLQIQIKNGLWYEMIIQPYRTTENLIEGIVITFVDITEAKKANEKLMVSEIKYKTLFQTAREGILILDGNTGMIQDVNPYFLELTGYSIDYLMKKKIWELGFLKDIAENKKMFEILKATKSISYENLPLEAKDGTSLVVEVISNAYEINGVNIIQFNIRDRITRALEG